jgi:Ni/Co efflux regulator RcnB
MRLLAIALLALVGVAFSAPASAQKDKDDKQGHGRGQQDHDRDGGREHRPGQPGVVVIPDRDRGTVYTYYRTEHAAGRCPPGLAKKDNGCMPPGQERRRWVVGQPLPVDVIYEPLPPVLLGQLSPAPAGYQYVRVANDVLMMAVGTRLIAGALADLSSF